MQGKINFNELSISNFNGSRAYLINGILNNDTIRGISTGEIMVIVIL